VPPSAPNGTFHRFATGKAAGGNIREMNSPWGVTLAPDSFGSHANHFLIGNFGSGTIMTFGGNAKFLGLLRGSEECPVTIDGLWGLAFGASGNAGVTTDLYFTAGPNGEAHGLFGVLQAGNEEDKTNYDGRDYNHQLQPSLGRTLDHQLTGGSVQMRPIKTNNRQNRERLLWAIHCAVD